MNAELDKNVLERQIKLERIDSHVYEVESHADWAMGPVLHGGCIAAVISKAAILHLTTTLKHLSLPDLHTLHYEFLRYCTVSRMRIVVQDLKLGKGSSLIQLNLLQQGDIKVITLVTATNFDISLGHTVNYDSWKHLQTWPESITTKMKPDFAKIDNEEPDDHWIPATPLGLLGAANRTRQLYLRGGDKVEGMVHVWEGFKGGERMGPVHVTLLADMFGSMSDTLLDNKGVYDMHKTQQDILEWSEKYPGKFHEVIADAKMVANAEIWNNTLVLDIEFKKRPPTDGYEWIFIRGTSTSFQKGRLDVRLDLYDQDFQPVALTKQVILVLGNERRWKKDKKGSQGKKNTASKL